MILYHFTSFHHLPLILRSDLSKGDIPLTPGRPGYKGVWFTTDDCPTGHGLSSGEKVSIPDNERSLFVSENGRPLPKELYTLDKRAVRIKVVIPSSHEKLFHWLKWSRKRTDAAYRQHLIQSGGGKDKARTWYIYNGALSCDEFKEVCVRADNGPYVRSSLEDLEKLRAEV